MEKILITGANGFIGSFLVEQALNSGMETFAAVRKSGNLKYLQDKRIKIVTIDFENLNSIRQLLKTVQFDYIIHAAGTTKAPSENDYLRINFEYFRELTEIIKTENSELKKLIFISSLAAFGPANNQKNKILDSYSTPMPITGYGKSKLKAEQYLINQQISYAIIRPTAVFGPRDTSFLSIYKTIKYGIEPLIGNSQNKLTFIYIKDLIEIIFKSLKTEGNHDLFVSDGKVYSQKDFYSYIKSYFGVKTVRIKVPVLLMKCVAYLNEFIGKLFNNYPFINRDKIKEITANSWNCDSGNIKKVLGYVPKYSLKQGVKETLNWYKNR